MDAVQSRKLISFQGRVESLGDGPLIPKPDPTLRILEYLCALRHCLPDRNSGAYAAEDGPAKRVLMVHSFGSTAPPFTTHSTAFETTLTQQMGKRVDLDEVSLDMARYAQPDMEEPFVEFLLKRLAKWHPDLVVPVGSPAGRFVAKYRNRLFPHTPVIYTGMDLRTLPPGAFDNATFVGESFNVAGLVEDILQLAPDTTNIAVVLGASPLERYWTVEFRRAFEPFKDRISFTWFNDLTFDQMLERVAKLPPRSFILIGLLLRDASGVTYNQDDALQRLHAVANAPINGMYQHQLGLGIVGGHLYQAEVQGAESARIAIRILRGEPAAELPTYDRPAARTAVRLARAAALEYQRGSPATRQPDLVSTADGVGPLPVVDSRCALYSRVASRNDRWPTTAANAPAPGGSCASAESRGTRPCDAGLYRWRTDYVCCP